MKSLLPLGLFVAAGIGLIASGPAILSADEVPAAPSCGSPCTGGKAEMKGSKDIVDVAVGAGSFNTLVTAVKEAGLVDTLKGKGPFTVFAPSDAAFGKLPEGTVGKLVKNKPALQGILTYHVIPGRVLSSDLKVGTTEVKTVQGQSIIVNRSRSGKVTVNGATVTTADVLAGNGVIHVIDAVILPKQ